MLEKELIQPKTLLTPTTGTQMNTDSTDEHGAASLRSAATKIKNQFSNIKNTDQRSKESLCGICSAGRRPADRVRLPKVHSPAGTPALQIASVRIQSTFIQLQSTITNLQSEIVQKKQQS